MTLAASLQTTLRWVQNETAALYGTRPVPLQRRCKPAVSGVSALTPHFVQLPAKHPLQQHHFNAGQVAKLTCSKVSGVMPSSSVGTGMALYPLGPTIASTR